MTPKVPLIAMLLVLVSRQIAQCASIPVAQKRPRDEASEAFKVQMINPSDVMSLLLLVGGDIVQKTIAQACGRRITFCSFSFGWVAYSLGALMNTFGDKTFMPKPDYASSVINIGSAGVKTSESWVISRLIRDLQGNIEKQLSDGELKTGLLISFFKAKKESAHPHYDWVSFSFWPTLAVQIVIAAIPLKLGNDWSILCMTAIGTLLAIGTSSLKEWRLEKYACGKTAPATYAITHGNGHKHVIVIEPGDGNTGLNLEHLAQPIRRVDRMTQLYSFLFALAWTFFLVAAAGIKKHSWFLVGVGALGMLHNIFIAGWKRTPEAHGIPLEHLKERTIGKGSSSDSPGRKAMKVLEDAENVTAGLGVALLSVYFSDAMLSTAEYNTWKPHRDAFRKVLDDKEARRNTAKQGSGKVMR